MNGSNPRQRVKPEATVAPDLTRAQLADFLECYDEKITVGELIQWLRPKQIDMLNARVTRAVACQYCGTPLSGVSIRSEAGFDFCSSHCREEWKWSHGGAED